MSEDNPTTSKKMEGKDNQKSLNSSQVKQSEAPPPSPVQSESKEKTETHSKKTETPGQPSCLNLPEFLNKKSQPEFDGVNPREKRQSELVLPAVGLERTTPMPMNMENNFSNSSASSSSLSSISISTSTSISLSDSDRENIVTEKIKDPDTLLDTIRAALLTCKNINRDNTSTNNNNDNKNNTNTNTEDSSNLKEHVEKIILYRTLIEQLSHHPHFRKPTDLLRLHELPKSYGLECEIWIKCEFQNFSGSSKYRVASLMLAELDLIHNNKSNNHHNSSDNICSLLKPSTIITHTSASFTLALACANIHMGKSYQLISILPDRTSKLKRTLLQSMGVKIYRAPEESSDNSQSNESPTMMAKFLAEKIKNSIVLNPFQHPLSLQTHYLWTAKEILEQFNSLSEQQKDSNIDIDMLVCGYETGGLISGLSPVFKDTNENCIIVGVDLSGQLQNNNNNNNKEKEVKYQSPVDPDTIFVEEYSSPFLSSVLNVKVADKWYHISLKDATNMARTMMLKEGIPVTATSGAVLQAAILAAKEFNLDSKKDAKILLVIDNFALYTDFDLGTDEWLLSRGYTTNLEIETTKWYHLIHCWRIPVKVPVTVFNDFNASAVYQMMKNDGIDRVIVQDSGTNAILGISTLTSLEKKLQKEKSLTEEDLIGANHSVCTSFQTICINNTISTLFELFKTKSYAILVQRQKFISATRGRLDQDWIAGILSIQDLVRFISDIEKRHGEKFGANLCGGFYRAKSTNTNVSADTDINKDEDMNIKEKNESKSKSLKEEGKYCNDERYQEKNSLASNSIFMKKPEDLVIGSHLKEAIVNVMIAETSEECSKSMEQSPPPALSSLDFSNLTPDLEPESTTEIISTAENGTDNAYQQAQGSVQTEARRLNAETELSSSGFSTPATFTFDHDSLILPQEINNPHNFYTPTRYHSMHRLENMQNSSIPSDEGEIGAEITLSEELNSDTYVPIGLEYSTMTLGDSLLSAWYSTTNEPMTITSDIAFDNPISSDNSSDVLLSVQSLPQNCVFNQFQSNIENDQQHQQELQQASSQSQTVLNSVLTIPETVPDRNDDDVPNSMEIEDGGNSNTIVIPTREQEEFVAPVLSEQCNPILNESLLNALPLVGTSIEAAAAEAQAMKFPGQTIRMRKIKEESTTVIKTIQSVYRISKELDVSASTNTNTTSNLISTPNTKPLKDSSSLDKVKSNNTFQDSTSPTSTTNIITTSVTANSSFPQNASSIPK